MVFDNPVNLPLDASLYNPKDDEIAFFKAQTGIDNDAQLRDHILRVQADAYAVHPYPCIRNFAFTSLKISRYPIYEDILKLGRERPGAILLDLGCCLGNNARKAVADGFPRENVIASDLRGEYWDVGHRLFKTTKRTYPVAFVAGDIFDPTFLSSTASPAPSSSAPPGPSPPPRLSTLTSLTPLIHHISVIHASAFFHLFSESQQRVLARLLGTLLSPLPGSMIVGSHLGARDADRTGGKRLTGRGTTTFAHTPRSWEEMWAGTGGVFKPEDVVFQTATKEFERKDILQENGYPGPAYKAYLLIWSVTRA